MQRVTVELSIFIFLLCVCILIFALYYLIKKKTHRPLLVVVCATMAVVIILIGIFLCENYQRNCIKDFSGFSIADLSQSTEMIEDLATDKCDVENGVFIGSFDLQFRKNTFSNLQFTFIFYESGGPFEQNYQINYEGQVFTGPKVRVISDVGVFAEKTVSLRELKGIMEILKKSDLIKELFASNANCVDIMFAGYANAALSENDASNIYVIQNENLIPSTQSKSIYQESRDYYIFSITSDVGYIQIYYPILSL